MWTPHHVPFQRLYRGKVLFSTSVELESGNVCVYVPKLWGALETSKMVRFGWNLAHLFLGRISGGVFFIFQKFWFLGPGRRVFRQNEAKTLGQPGDPKNGPIWLKFGTFVPWVNIWVFFHFSKNVKFWAWDEFFKTATIGPPNSWKILKLSPVRCARSTILIIQVSKEIKAYLKGIN